jgi:hypothetical protein
MQDRDAFIEDQYGMFNQLMSQGTPGGAQGAPAAVVRASSYRMIEQFEAAQRRNRDSLIQEQDVRRNALHGLQQGGTSTRNMGGTNGACVVRQQAMRLTSAHEFTGK